jgi:primase-polymerase (primpol)-like protein
LPKHVRESHDDECGVGEEDGRDVSCGGTSQVCGGEGDFILCPGFLEFDSGNGGGVHVIVKGVFNDGSRGVEEREFGGEDSGDLRGNSRISSEHSSVMSVTRHV